MTVIETDHSVSGNAPHGGGLDTMLDLIRQRIAALGLDLSDLAVVTEAATGAYAATAVIAAVAGARRVHAVARDTARHGSFRDAADATLTLAQRAGVADRITISRRLSPEAVASCDILTNCGHLRPITREIIARLRLQTVIALMFEAWEFRAADIDLDACREFGIRVAAVNERHPAVGVFPFLGPLCLRLLAEAGAAMPNSRIAVVCDNPFAPFIEAGLRGAGLSVSVVERLAQVPASAWDALVIALNPAWNGPLGAADFDALAAVAPGARLIQFWGDMDRAEAARHGFARIRPEMPPARGHMGLLLSALGPEPIIRLQTGGLRAAELAVRGVEPVRDGVLEYL